MVPLKFKRLLTLLCLMLTKSGLDSFFAERHAEGDEQSVDSSIVCSSISNAKLLLTSLHLPRSNTLTAKP